MSIDTISLYSLSGIIYIITLTNLLVKRNYSLINHIALLGFFISITLFIGYWFFPLDTSISKIAFEESKLYKASFVPFKKLFNIPSGIEMLYINGMITNLGLPIVSIFCISILKQRRKLLRSVIVTGIVLMALSILGVFNYYLWTLDTSGFDSAYLIFNLIGIAAGYWLFKATCKAFKTVKGS